LETRINIDPSITGSGPQFHPPATNNSALFMVCSVPRQYNLAMITGVHLLLMSRDPQADRAFFRDVLEFAFVDAGAGWLIFVLPPTELGIHPAETIVAEAHAGKNISAATIYLMCEDLDATLKMLGSKNVEHTDVLVAEWGVTTTIRLPGGGDLGLYEPHHQLAIASRNDTHG
jgi:catechol 2,3-dioxygenase-like lactoylglutathione lyase family enzyme